VANITLRSVKGSALTFQEADDNFNNLNTSKLESVSADTAPSLGGNLNTNSRKIVTTDASGFIKIGNPMNLDGLPLAAALGDPVTLYSGITSGANSILALFSNNGDFTKPSLTINPNTNQINFQVATVPIVSIGANTVSFNRPITSFTGTDLVLNPNQNTVVNKMIYNETVFSLGTTSGTIAPNAANGAVQTITLDGNLTLNAFTSPVAGQSVTLIVNTGGTGRTLTSSMKFAGGEKTLSTTDTTDIISIFYDGVNYWASLAKDFN